MSELFFRVARFLRIFFLSPWQMRYLRELRRSKRFDASFYKGAYPVIHPWYHSFPERHFIVYGEARNYRPNPDFSPQAYVDYNPDVAGTGIPPFYHYITVGHKEVRLTKELPKVEDMPASDVPRLAGLTKERGADHAVVAHVYYPELWPEFAETLRAIDIDFDLFVTVTYKGDETEEVVEEIKEEFPNALVTPVPNKGRDILPFLLLVNAGLLDGYKAVCKIHTKKSPHREDGDTWRKHLIGGILPKDTKAVLEAFEADRGAAFWVADGQYYDDTRWWGSNKQMVKDLLRRLEIEISGDHLAFPAGSMYWMKPIIVGLLKSLRLDDNQFDIELGQVDGTVAHAIERAMGFLSEAREQTTRQETELREQIGTSSPAVPTPKFVSAFYLPQFHPIPENDAWWGKGFTEWRGVVGSRSMFAGHSHPVLPLDLGYYDLRATEVLDAQAKMAQTAGVDAFCVYHYWFGGKRVLEAPLDNLLNRPDVAFPFYLCWANESWRRNWDGLSGHVLLEQDYGDGFEAALAADTARYMRDPRYQRPDGTRPRFVIYRPEDMPEPEGSVERLRAAWRAEGVGEVELGAVRFHIEGEHPVSDDLFDFWIEMPPHGLVKSGDYLVGGPDRIKLEQPLAPGFEGLVYDYNNVIERSVSDAYVDDLPQNTICGVMPSWDNTARRGHSAHIAYGANPARFGHWLDRIAEERLDKSYRGELFVNAWNEWAEKAMLEPGSVYGDLYLRVLAEAVGRDT